jgi:hypothetical protein
MRRSLIESIRKDQVMPKTSKHKTKPVHAKVRDMKPGKDTKGGFLKYKPQGSATHKIIAI